MSLPIRIDSIALLRVTIVAQLPPLGLAVLRCLSMTNVVVTQVSEMAHCEELHPDAFILFANDYPSPDVVDFVRRTLFRTTAISLLTDCPREFEALLTTDQAEGRLTIVPQLKFGCDLLDLVFGLTARLLLRDQRVGV